MLKTVRYIILLAIVGLALFGIVTVNLAYKPFIYLLAAFYIVTLIIQAKHDQKKSLVIFYGVVTVAALVLFVVALMN